MSKKKNAAGSSRGAVAPATSKRTPTVAGDPPSTPVPWIGRLLPILLLASVGAAAIWLAVRTLRAFEPYALASWGHDAGLQYYKAQLLGLHLRAGDPISFVADMFALQVIWPPMHTGFTGIVLAIGGPAYQTASIASAIAFVIAAMLLAWAAYLVTVASFAPARGEGAARRTPTTTGARLIALVAGVIAAALFASAPAARMFLVLPMQEMAGHALHIGVVLAYVRVLRLRQAGRWETAGRAMRTVAVMMTLLALTRYAPWMLMVLALLAVELAWLRPVQWRSFGRFLRRLFRGPDKQKPDPDRPALPRLRIRPLWWIGGLLLALFVFNLVVRPFGDEITIGSSTIYINPAGNLVYFAAIAFLLDLVWLAIRYRRHLRAALDRVPASWRSLVLWHALPVYLYFMWPHKIRLMLGNLFARQASHQNVELANLDLIGILMRDFVRHEAFLVAGLLVALYALIRVRTLPTVLRSVWGVALVGSLPILLFPHEERYFQPALPLMILAGAATVPVALADLLATVRRMVTTHHGTPPASDGRVDERIARPGIAAALGIAVLLGGAIGAPVVLLAERHADDPVPRADFQGPYEAAVREAIVSAIGDDPRPTLVLAESLSVVKQHINARLNEEAGTLRPGVDAELSLGGREPAAAIERELSARQPLRIITYRTGPSPRIPMWPEYVQLMNAFLLRSDWRRVDRIDYSHLHPGDRLEIWEPVAEPQTQPAAPQ